MMKTLIFMMLLIAGTASACYAQERKPAMAKKSEVQAPGYIKGTPSNKQQDKMLKKIDAEEKKAYAPKGKPKTRAPKTNKGVTRE